jgi:hypothetical protein
MEKPIEDYIIKEIPIAESVKTFGSCDLESIQDQINDWLDLREDVRIISTHFNTTAIEPENVFHSVLIVYTNG